MPRHDIGFELTEQEIQKLEKVESKAGHKWERRNGHILIKSLGNKCLGPTCAYCGYRFCLLCDWPMPFEYCASHKGKERAKHLPKQETSAVFH